MPLETLPNDRAKLFDEAFIVRHKDTGEILRNYPYRIVRADGSIEEGVTGEDGKTHIVMTADPEELILELPEH